MMKNRLNVLIACEESQVGCIAFRELGCNAFSCDIQSCAGHHPEWHILGDVTPLLTGETKFVTCDGIEHHVPKWDLIVAHPPCTHLCKISTSAHKRGKEWLGDYYEKMLRARDFFFLCLNAKADFVAVENPLPHAEAQLPKPTFYTCPSQFGAKYTKKTLWWCRNLPPVLPTIFYPNPRSFCNCSRGKYRSRTFVQVAQAMANAWVNHIAATRGQKAVQ